MREKSYEGTKILKYEVEEKGWGLVSVTEFCREADVALILRRGAAR
jgi:hypothetical protein